MATLQQELLLLLKIYNMKYLTELENKYKSDKGTEEGGCHAFSEIYDE